MTRTQADYRRLKESSTPTFNLPDETMDDLSTTTPTVDKVSRRSNRKTKKPVAKPVVDRKQNFLTLKPLLQSKHKRPKNFKLFKESSLHWNSSINSMFKEYEIAQHKGADQDVDTDDDNIEFGRSQLLDDLRKQISNFQTDEQYAVRNIRNTTMFKHIEGIQFLTLD